MSDAPDGLHRYHGQQKAHRRREITTLRSALSALMRDTDPILLRTVLAALRAQGHRAIAEAPRSTDTVPVLRKVFTDAMREEGIRRHPCGAQFIEIYFPGETRVVPPHHTRQYVMLTRKSEHDMEQLRRQLWAMR